MTSRAPATATTSASTLALLRRLTGVRAGAGPGIGFTVLGAGLLALAAVEAGLLVQPSASQRGGGTLAERTPAAEPLGFREAALNAVKDPPAVPERGGTIISITTDSTTYGTALYRLWSSGRVEASVLGESNVWTDWTPVGPGLSGETLKSKAKPKDK